MLAFSRSIHQLSIWTRSSERIAFPCAHPLARKSHYACMHDPMSQGQGNCLLVLSIRCRQADEQRHCLISSTFCFSGLPRLAQSTGRDEATGRIGWDSWLGSVHAEHWYPILGSIWIMNWRRWLQYVYYSTALPLAMYRAISNTDK